MKVFIVKRYLKVSLSLFVILLVGACSGNEEAGVAKFSEWDANNNNEISQEEFNQGAFQNWDINNSETLDKNEFDTANKTFFTGSDINFNAWDTNNNGELTQQEFSQGASDAGLFGEWNTDNNSMIDRNEFNQATSQG